MTAVKKVNGQPVHFIEGDLPPVGTAVTGQLDWERRYQLMRTHTAMHILCGVVWRDYGAQVTGGNMEPGAGRMDFEFETMRRNWWPRSRPRSTPKYRGRGRRGCAFCLATRPWPSPT